MKKVMLIFGTRPEAIKMCPLVLELKRQKEIETIVCVTGQHREMLDQVLAIFGIKADYDLNIMIENQTLFDVTNNILNKIQAVLSQVKPALICVHGDTSTAFVSGLAAFYSQIPIAHIEAGLRTYNLASPFPEEFNRQAISILAALNFAPTPLAKRNLLNEQHDPNKIFVTGNTVIDALKTTIKPTYVHPLLEWVGKSKLILMTAHRRENLGEPMRHMFKALAKILADFPDVKALYPIHRNPKVRALAHEIFTDSNQIKLIEPLDVIDFHNFMNKATLILTDSGGIQEEAPALGKPVLVMRDTTERPEGVEAGTLKLVGTSYDSIYQNCKHLLEDDSAYQAMAQAKNPYGDGTASQQITKIVCDYLGCTYEK